MQWKHNASSRDRNMAWNIQLVNIQWLIRTHVDRFELSCTVGHVVSQKSYKPSEPCFLPSSTLMSFFLTRRVELTSL